MGRGFPQLWPIFRARNALLAASLALVPHADGHAQTVGQTKPPWREVWVGADANLNGWLVFTGATVAPFSGIHDPGLRLRVGTGYGMYSYEGIRRNISFNAPLGRFVEHGQHVSFEAQTGFADVLAGYLWRLDPLTLKVFAGASGIGHAIAPHDEENLAIGFDWGPKAVVEMWLNIGEDMWGSLDLSWTSAHDTRSARARLGYRATGQLSLGVEARIDIDTQGDCDLRWVEGEACKAQYRNRFGSETSIFDYSRGGVFARYEWAGGEVSAAAGASGAPLGRDANMDIEPYVTIGWITQF